jgi:hypothetical protein
MLVVTAIIATHMASHELEVATPLAFPGPVKALLADLLIFSRRARARRREQRASRPLCARRGEQRQAALDREQAQRRSRSPLR